MRLTVVYPTSRQEFADELSRRLTPIRGLDVSWVGTSAEDFVSDLTEAAQSEEPLVVVMDATLPGSTQVPARVRWAPLLQRIESGESGSLGLVLLSQLDVPPLLRKARTAVGDHLARSVTRWVIRWLGLGSTIVHTSQGANAGLPDETVENLMTHLVDRSGLAIASCECEYSRVRAASRIATMMAPYFEAVYVIQALQRTKALRDAELSRIVRSGRTLWIVVAHEGDVPDLPADASMLVIGKGGGLAIQPEEATGPLEDPGAQAVALIPLIPTVEGEELQFSTYEFERLLPQLFAQHWSLAERMARRAGSFFRINHRVPEAIWVYETLKWQATLQGQMACAADCENELYWLRAGGARKQALETAGQTTFEF